MASPMRNLRFRLWLAVICFLVGMVLLVYAVLPTARIQQVQQLPPVTLPSPTPTSLLLVLEVI